MNNRSTVIMYMKQALFLILGVTLVYMLHHSAVDARFQTLENEARAHIAEQEALLIAIAETTARNGGDAVTEAIVKDCVVTERVRFDGLLGRLNAGLPQAELLELERLFGRCGSFYSERKSLMVARLAREIEVYEAQVQQLGIILDADVSEQFSVPQWQALAAQEQIQGELFSELVRLQDQIIAALISGTTVESEEMSDILRQVAEVQETLVVANLQAGSIRSELVPL